MIRSPLGLRLDPGRPTREQIREAARLGAKGVVLEAVGELGPDRLSETGRRELRHLLRSAELALVALHLPTRRPFDTLDQLDDRLRRAEAAYSLAYDLGTRTVLARIGGVPPEAEPARREVFLGAAVELGRRADHRGVRLGIETGADPGDVVRGLLDGLDLQGLGASLDPAALLQQGHDPAVVARELGPWLIHAYANEATRPSGVSLPKGRGFAAGSFEWEEFLGSLEEINYAGYLTVWPDPAREAGPQFAAIVARLSRF